MSETERIDKLDENGVGHIPANTPYNFSGNGFQQDAAGRNYQIVNGQMKRLDKPLSKKAKRRLGIK